LQTATCINGVFYAATDGFLVKTADNGENWQRLMENGVGIHMSVSLGVSQSNHYLTISGSQDNGISIKKLNQSLEFYGADGMDGVINTLNNDWMIGSAQFGERRKTTDGGLTNTGVTPVANAGWNAPLFYDPNDQMTVYSLADNLYKSTDFGTFWNNVGAIGFPGDAQNAAIAQNNSQIMVASYVERIRKTTDGGVTWTSIKNNLPNKHIVDIAFDPNDDDTIIVVYNTHDNSGQKVYITTNGGTNWTNISYNLANMPINSVVIDHTNDATIYLGAERGVYKKNMADNTWTLYNTNLPNVSVLEMEIMNATNTLRIATWGRGLWETSLANRQDYPAILTTSITDTPTLIRPQFGSDQFVTSTIDYSGTLANVVVKWSANTATFDKTIAMTNTTGSTWVSNAPFTYQVGDTKIFFKVVATGSNNDTTETYKLMYNAHPFDYCDATSVTSTYEYITNVKFNTIDNTSAESNYSDFTALSTDIQQGNSYDFEISYTGTSTGDQVKAWIDFNQNKIFTDPGEAFLISYGKGSNSPYTKSIAIPATALLGNTRMRVNLNYLSSSATLPCGNPNYGEYEDYTVNIIQNTTLSNQTNGTIPNLNVYPNPTTGKLQINLGNSYKNTQVKVANVLGQTVLSKNYTQTKNISLNIDTASGVYFLTINADGNQTTIKIIKE